MKKIFLPSILVSWMSMPTTFVVNEQVKIPPKERPFLQEQVSPNLQWEGHKTYLDKLDKVR